MSKKLTVIFWVQIAFHVSCAICAAFAGYWMVLGWIVAATMLLIELRCEEKKTLKLQKECARLSRELFHAEIDGLKIQLQNLELLTKQVNHIERRKKSFDKKRKEMGK